MAKEKTVITGMDFSNIDGLTAEQREQLARQLLSSLGITKEAQLLAERKTSLTSHIDAEVKRIDAEIAAVREQIAPLNERIKSLMSEKASLGVKGTTNGERTREVTTCPECGQGRHADNDKTKACKTYAAFVPVRDAAKAAKTAVPTFSEFLKSHAA